MINVVFHSNQAVESVVLVRPTNGFKAPRSETDLGQAVTIWSISVGDGGTASVIDVDQTVKEIVGVNGPDRSRVPEPLVLFILIITVAIGIVVVGVLRDRVGGVRRGLSCV